MSVLQRDAIVPHALRILRETATRADIKPIVSYLRRAEHTDAAIRDAVCLQADEVARAGWKRPWQPLAEWVYENAPGAVRRSFGFDWIYRVGKMSREMLEEARYDADENTRGQAEERSRKPKPPFLKFAARND